MLVLHNYIERVRYENRRRNKGKMSNNIHGFKTKFEQGFELPGEDWCAGHQLK